MDPKIFLKQAGILSKASIKTYTERINVLNRLFFDNTSDERKRRKLDLRSMSYYINLIKMHYSNENTQIAYLMTLWKYIDITRIKKPKRLKILFNDNIKVIKNKVDNRKEK